MTRSIRVVAGTGRKRVGVLQTAINVFGGLDFQTMHNAPEWPIVEELKKQYDVVRLQPGAEIPSDLDGLLVVLPSSLTQPAMDALAAAIHRGIPTLLLEDPLPWSIPVWPRRSLREATESDDAQSGAPGAEGEHRSPDGRDRHQLESRARGLGHLQSASRSGHLPPEVVFVGKGNENAEAFNVEGPESAPLQELVLLYPGDFQKAVDTRLEFIPLVETGKVRVLSSIPSCCSETSSEYS